jgi:hypothetical protein
MLKGLRLIGGTGVRTAHSIHWKSTKDAQEDLNMTFATSVKQRKPTRIAEFEGLDRIT